MAEQPFSLKERIKSHIAVSTMQFFASFSLRNNQRIGTALGRLLYRLPNNTKHVAKTNIALCFPHLSAHEQAELVQSTLIENAKGAAEMTWLWHKPREALARVKDVMDVEAVHETIAANKPDIILAPHLATLEMQH